MLAPDEIVDRFQIVELLGAGGIAQVYKARHRVLGSLHALKVVTAGGPAVARRLVREGSIQAQLRHPNVVAVTDVIEVRGHTALVLEYVEGVTLQELLAQKGALPLDEALALYAQVLSGVAAAHAAGVLHRDLKPANVLLTPGPAGVLAKVADFGLAKVMLDDAPAEPGDTMQGLAMGTPGYMAPEQVGEAGTADARADVFALGVVLYEMLGGAQPFRGDDITATLINTLRAQPRPLTELAPDLPPAVVATVERCLAQDRRDRFADARELARALYGDRPELAEIVEGSRPAAPLAISLPSMAPLRAGGLGSAAGPANPTLGPAAFDAVGPAAGTGSGVASGASSSWGGALPRNAPPGGAPPVPPVSGVTPSANQIGADQTGPNQIGAARADDIPSDGALSDGAIEDTDATRAEPASVRSDAPRPSRRWLLSAFGLLSGFGVVAALGFVLLSAAGLDDELFGGEGAVATRGGSATGPAEGGVVASASGTPGAATAGGDTPAAVAAAEGGSPGSAGSGGDAGSSGDAGSVGGAGSSLAAASPAGTPSAGTPSAGSSSAGSSEAGRATGPSATTSGGSPGPTASTSGGSPASTTASPTVASAAGNPAATSATGGAPAGVSATEAANAGARVAAIDPGAASGPASGGPSAAPGSAATIGAGVSAAATDSESAAARSGAEAVVADAAPVTEAPAAPAAAPVAGTWKGAWDGRPFTLTLSPEGADRVGARLEVLVGTSYRTFRLSGPVDASGRFTLTEEGSAGWWLEGALSGSSLAGSIRAPEAKKASAFTARRK